MLIEKLIEKKIQGNAINVNSNTLPDQLQNYQYRLDSTRLKWCKQAKNILKSNYKFSTKLKSFTIYIIMAKRSGFGRRSAF